MNELPVVSPNKAEPALPYPVFQAIHPPVCNSFCEQGPLVLLPTPLDGQGQALKTEHIQANHRPGPQAINRVLIIDGNDSNRRILKQLLPPEQVESDEAQNGIEALNLLARGTRYDVIIVEYDMPYMDGIKAIRKIRKNFPDPSRKIILLHSPSGDELMIRAAEELNITSRLTKPIKMQEMYQHLFHSFPNNTTPSLQPEATAEASLPCQPVTLQITEENGASVAPAKTITGKTAPDPSMIEAVNGPGSVKCSRAETAGLVFKADPPPVEEKAPVSFDLQQVINYLDGDTGFAVEFLGLIQKELELSLVDLQAAAQARNLPALNAAAHKLTSTALITGMEKLSSLAKVLEKLAAFHESTVNGLLGDVRQEISEVIKHMEGSKNPLQD